MIIINYIYITIYLYITFYCINILGIKTCQIALGIDPICLRAYVIQVTINKVTVILLFLVIQFDMLTTYNIYVINFIIFQRAKHYYYKDIL